MASRLPPPRTYIKSKDGKKITPLTPNIPLEVASISGFGFAIATKMPPSEREVAIMKAAKEAAEAEAAKEFRQSIDSMDTIDRTKDDVKFQKTEKKKRGAWFSRFT